MVLQQCAYEPCTCLLGSGDTYCSRGCEEQRGCDHAGCNCGESSEKQRVKSVTG